MLIAGNFIMNALATNGGDGAATAPGGDGGASGGAGRSVTVHPWVLQTCNVLEVADQVRGCVVPDVPPNSLPAGAQLSMCAGDFLEVYKSQVPLWIDYKSD